jgi:hypothetical protein
MGLMFDDRGNRMSPSHSRKDRVQHRYYVSSALIRRPPETVGSVARAPAAKVEFVVIEAVGVRKQIGHDAPVDNAKLILAHVCKIEMRGDGIAITLRGRVKMQMTKSTLPSFSPWLGARRLPHAIARS